MTKREQRYHSNIKTLKADIVLKPMRLALGLSIRSISRPVPRKFSASVMSIQKHDEQFNEYTKTWIRQSAQKIKEAYDKMPPPLKFSEMLRVTDSRRKQ